jgi:hypothetical protein
MVMLDIVKSVSVIVKSKQLKDYRNETVENFADLLMGNVLAPAKQGVATIKLVLSIPDILFWDKMQRFLIGTYTDFEEQIKMCGKFDDEEKYQDFTKRQIHIINELNDDRKVGYFAKLTRSVLLELIDIPLYFKLASILSSATREELDYLKDNITSSGSLNMIYLESLQRYGLTVLVKMVVNDESDDDSCFTPLAICLDKYCLDMGSEVKYKYGNGIVKYEEITVVKTKEKKKTTDWTVDGGTF